jgi:integrase/recombinase XerD
MIGEEEDEGSIFGTVDEDLIERVVEKQPVANHLRDVRARNAYSTLKNRRVSVEQFARFCDRKGITFDEVSKVEVNDWINRFLDNDYAPRTIRTKVYDISALYQDLVARDAVDENPVEDVKLKRFTGTKIEDSDEPRYLEIDEYKSMVEECDKLRNRLVLELLWETGCRAAEAVSIKISDIDREDRRIEIESAKKGELSSTDKRKVYYSRSFEYTLKEWLDKGGRKSYLGVTEDNEGYLLVTKESDEMAVNRVTEIVRDIAERADIQKVIYTNASGMDRHRVTAHIFRYSYAVHRTRQGIISSGLTGTRGY